MTSTQKIEQLKEQAREWQKVLYNAAQMRNARRAGRAHRELNKLWAQIDALKKG
jgi:hypothetical protein